jgi:hypothetical protein
MGAAGNFFQQASLLKQGQDLPGGFLMNEASFTTSV